MCHITPENLGGLLFNVHHHHPDNEKIIYYEDDILDILRVIGLPDPVWGKNLTLKKYKGIKNEASPKMSRKGGTRNDNRSIKK